MPVGQFGERPAIVERADSGGLVGRFFGLGILHSRGKLAKHFKSSKPVRVKSVLVRLHVILFLGKCRRPAWPGGQFCSGCKLPRVVL